jgi:small subunit ribosomal protein S20
MAITKSAKKAWRQSLKRKARNLIYKTKIKKLIKEVRGLVLAKKIEEAKKLLPQVYKILDKAEKVRVIKKNTATRKKSRIAKAIGRSK